jgi:ABC-type glycerol-3-phosphate transport system substrate-binding protein
VTSRAFGGLAVVVVVVAAAVGVAIGAATAPQEADPGAAPVTSAPVTTPTTTPPASAVVIELSAPESAAANNRFELTGVVTDGAGGEQLQVQRQLDGGE